MARSRMRIRALDVAVTLVAACLCVTPFIPGSQAGSLYETGLSVDQEVKQTALISKPLSGRFDLKRSGRTSGEVNWDVYSSAGDGFKLVVSADGTPAMRDSVAGSYISDYSSALNTWSVLSGERRFGFSASGAKALGVYEQGKKFRGFAGGAAIEISRRREGPVAVTRTTLVLRSEFDSPLPSSARPRASITGTAMLNM